MGLPTSILDEDIYVDMPSDTSPQQDHDEQFSDTQYMVASINLARIAGETITKIYSRKKYKETFLQRVQALLKALKSWVETLPEHIKLNTRDIGLTPKHIISLHLSFNQVSKDLPCPMKYYIDTSQIKQCVILATRPTLLHVLTELNKHGKEAAANNRNTISQAALTLAEACIHAAQHSHSLIIERWISGSLPVLGYFYAQYLFSAALVLAMSSLISSKKTSNDMESFETASQVLHYMSSNGNFAAAEFVQNLEEVKRCLENYLNRGERQVGSGSEGLTVIAADTAIMLPASSLVSQEMENGFPTAQGIEMGLPARNASNGFTTEMAFLEPTMQAFLEQSDLDLGVLNPADMAASDSSSMYFWPTPQWVG